MPILQDFIDNSSQTLGRIYPDKRSHVDERQIRRTNKPRKYGQTFKALQNFSQIEMKKCK